MLLASHRYVDADHTSHKRATDGRDNIRVDDRKSARSKLNLDDQKMTYAELRGPMTLILSIRIHIQTEGNRRIDLWS